MCGLARSTAWCHWYVISCSSVHRAESPGSPQCNIQYAEIAARIIKLRMIRHSCNTLPHDLQILPSIDNRVVRRGASSSSARLAASDTFANSTSDFSLLSSPRDCVSELSGFPAYLKANIGLCYIIASVYIRQDVLYNYERAIRPREQVDRVCPLVAMKSIIISILSVVSYLIATISAERVKYNFNSDWKLIVDDPLDVQDPGYDDSSWKIITTPHAWNEDDAFHVDIANLSTGIAWYRKRFRLPATSENKKVFLEFEGIRHGGEFYLNGQCIGRSENGVMAFGFDISDLVLQGKDNVVAARIDNSWDYREIATNSKYQWNDRNFYANYGGINKNVYLHVTEKLYQTLPLYSNLRTTGVYVYAHDLDVSRKSATITAEAEIRNDYPGAKGFVLTATIKNAGGKIIKSITSRRYSVAPNSTIVATVSGHVDNLNFWSWGYGYLYDVATTVSVDGRNLDSVTTKTGFRKTDFSSGIFELNDRALHLKGYAQRTTNEWPALGSAVPAWLSDFSNSLVLASHGALIRWMHVTPWRQDVESLDRLGLLQAMPAGDSEGDVTGGRWQQRLDLMRDAIIYNRNSPSVIFYESGNHGISEDHMAEMKAIRDKWDPKGGRAIGSREMLNSTVAEYGGEMLYINKGKRIPLWQMEYSRDEGLRKYWDNYSPPYHQDGTGSGEAPEYMRNQDSHAIEDVVRWFDYYEQRPGTGERVNSGGVNIIFSDSNTHHRGEENYRVSGEVDPMRLPKDGWYAHQVMWDNWVDIEKPAVHIIGHWNYEANLVKNITIVSTADEVELHVNGKSIGWGDQSKRFLFTFPNVTYHAGTLEARAYNGENHKAPVAVDTRKTSGAPAAIRLTPHTSPSGFLANGADIALIDVEVVDAHGQRCPIALNMIDFTLSGCAEWRGGIAQGPDNYILSKSLPVENSVNRVMLRSTTNAGSINLRAESDGLRGASIKLKTVPFKTNHGLSLTLPGDDLPAYLSRGPTPQGQSYTTKRNTLHVSSAPAGSNTEGAILSLDDNEYSQWESSSTTNIAWISYQLDKAAVINQVVFKPLSFRTKSYKMEVFVDGAVVWTGSTPTSLGYVTLDFNETTGSNITLASTSGKLAIIEAEFYGPLEPGI